MIKKLNNLGFKVTYEEVSKLVRGSIGRPHVARLLLKKYPKEFANVKDVFNKYLEAGKPAYVDRTIRTSPEDAINMIKQANGIPILAHPGTFKKQESLELIKLCIKAGIKGIETYYPYHIICPELKINQEQNSELVKFYQKISKKNSMLEVGGSDFHGKAVRDIKLGCMNVPDKVLANLKTAICKSL